MSLRHGWGMLSALLLAGITAAAWSDAARADGYCPTGGCSTGPATTRELVRPARAARVSPVARSSLSPSRRRPRFASSRFAPSQFATLATLRATATTRPAGGLGRIRRTIATVLCRLRASWPANRRRWSRRPALSRVRRRKRRHVAAAAEVGQSQSGSLNVGISQIRYLPWRRKRRQGSFVISPRLLADRRVAILGIRFHSVIGREYRSWTPSLPNRSTPQAIYSPLGTSEAPN